MTKPLNAGERIVYESGTTSAGEPLTHGYNSVSGELVVTRIGGVKQLPAEPAANYPVQRYLDGRPVLTDAEKQRRILRELQQSKQQTNK